jgi:hypothetical protein
MEAYGSRPESWREIQARHDRTQRTLEIACGILASVLFIGGCVAWASWVSQRDKEMTQALYSDWCGQIGQVYTGRVIRDNEPICEPAPISFD